MTVMAKPDYQRCPLSSGLGGVAPYGGKLRLGDKRGASGQEVKMGEAGVQASDGGRGMSTNMKELRQ
jgi:hypothetical protein